MGTLFYISSAVAILATIMVITRHHPIHALLYLVVSFLAIAMVFIAIGAPFIGVLEVIVYAGAIMVLIHSKPEDVKDAVVYFMGIDEARFRRPIVPGDQLRLEVELLHKHRPLWRLKGQAKVDGKVAAEAEFLTMEVDASELGV